ncbi:hypothetical protein ACWEPL_17890 [Nonomuraea sp. NPDC004186]
MRTVRNSALAMAATTGWPALSSLPADATPVPTRQPPTVSCRYALTKPVVGSLRNDAG